MNEIVSARRQRARDSGLWQAYRRSRYAILFYSLLLMLVAMPVVSTFGVLERVMRIFLAACLLAAVMPSADKQTRYLLPLMVLAVALAQIGSERGYLPVASGLLSCIVGLIGLFSAAAALRFMANSRGVDQETIYAALSTYLLAGLFFGEIYFSIESIWPGSITGPDNFSEIDAVYFSFVTLASLGYGDFLPRTGLARGIAVLEVVGGQLFLAVLVARLVGLFRVGRNKE